MYIMQPVPHLMKTNFEVQAGEQRYTPTNRHDKNYIPDSM